MGLDHEEKEEKPLLRSSANTNTAAKRVGESYYSTFKGQPTLQLFSSPRSSRPLQLSAEPIPPANRPDIKTLGELGSRGRLAVYLSFPSWNLGSLVSCGRTAPAAEKNHFANCFV
jgi:hypothetical protein